MKKLILNFTAALMFFSMFIFTAGAEPLATETAPVTETKTTTTAVTTFTLPPFPGDETYPEFNNLPPDIIGNAKLVEKQQVIYSDGSFEFMSVTTKGGYVFYIFINRNLDGTANVWFLNKVDEYDLYKILYANDENQKVPGPPAQTAPPADANPNPVRPDVPQNKPPLIPLPVAILMGVAVLGGIGFLLWQFVFSKKKAKPDYDDDDYDEDDGVYVSEDE